MKQSKWLGIGVGTLVASLAIWFGLFAVESNRITGLGVIAVGIIFAMYAMVVFSGAQEGQTVAFHASLYAIVTATTLMIIFTATDSPSYLVASPVLALGIGGAIGLPPDGEPLRTLARVAGVVAVALVAVAVYWVDHTVYAIIAPLMPLPAVGLADRLLDGARAVINE